jgi:hypothetical protein
VIHGIEIDFLRQAADKIGDKVLMNRPGSIKGILQNLIKTAKSI